MPAGDRTGPMGMGPMTGRGLGYCAGYPAPGYMHPAPGRGMGWGRGWGRGRGLGRGWGRGWRAGSWGAPDYGYAQTPNPYYYGAQPGYPAPQAPEQEAAMLKQQAQDMESTLQEIKQRIEELEAEKQQKQ
jgi:hypothetical protein